METKSTLPWSADLPNEFSYDQAPFCAES